MLKYHENVLVLRAVKTEHVGSVKIFLIFLANTQDY